MDRESALRAFVRVSELGSFSRAANSLGLSRAAVTTQVKNLEAELGKALFFRTTRSVRLTSDGEALLAGARLALDGLDSVFAGKGRGGAPRGHVRIAAPAAYSATFLGNAVFRFLEKEPAVSVTLVTPDRPVDLVEERMELEFTIGEVPKPLLVAWKIGSVRSILCASPSFLKKHGIPKTAEDLEGLPLVAGAFPLPEWKLAKESDGRAFTVKPFGRFSSPNTILVTQAARAGCGVALLPDRGAAPFIESGELVPVLPEYGTDPLPVYATSVSRNLSAPARAFLEFVRNEMQRSGVNRRAPVA